MKQILLHNIIFRIMQESCYIYRYVKNISRKLYILWEKELIESRRAENSSFSKRMYTLKLLSYLKHYFLCVDIGKCQVIYSKSFVFHYVAPKKTWTAVFSRYLSVFYRFLRKTAVMYQFSAVWRACNIWSLAVISNTAVLSSPVLNSCTLF